jgi:hypothetical protein
MGNIGLDVLELHFWIHSRRFDNRPNFNGMDKNRHPMELRPPLNGNKLSHSSKSVSKSKAHKTCCLSASRPDFDSDPDFDENPKIPLINQQLK